MGETGVIRLRLDKAYVPLYVRLADYADKLKDDSTLALETFLLDFIERNYPGAKRQGEFLRKDLILMSAIEHRAILITEILLNISNGF